MSGRERIDPDVGRLAGPCAVRAAGTGVADATLAGTGAAGIVLAASAAAATGAALPAQARVATVARGGRQAPGVGEHAEEHGRREDHHIALRIHAIAARSTGAALAALAALRTRSTRTAGATARRASATIAAGAAGCALAALATLATGAGHGQHQDARLRGDLFHDADDRWERGQSVLASVALTALRPLGALSAVPAPVARDAG